MIMTRYYDNVDNGREIIYMDESWINQNVTPNSCWNNGTVDTVDEVKPGKGPRWIIIAAGSKNEWLGDTFRMWKGTVKSEDYHSEMNGEVFFDWMHKYLLPAMPPTV